jgi:hypothetical protein
MGLRAGTGIEWEDEMSNNSRLWENDKFGTGTQGYIESWVRNFIMLIRY